tara:strand:+ start:363 stop:554 length:192 start_codon:yes stop_codon:yes gene_type:complete
MVDGTHILYSDNYKRPILKKSKSNNIIYYIFPCFKKDKLKKIDNKLVLDTQPFTYDDIFKDSS